MTNDQQIAIVGYGIVLAGASDPAEMWRTIREGKHQIGHPVLWDADLFPSAVAGNPARGGFIRSVNLHPKLAEEIKTGDWAIERNLATTLLRHSTLQALESVKYTADQRWMYVVASCGEQAHLHLNHIVVADLCQRLIVDKFNDQPGGAAIVERIGDALASRHHHGFDQPVETIAPYFVQEALRGLLPPSAETLVIDSACASSIHAMHTAASALREGSCELALCGSTVTIAPSMCEPFNLTGVLSRTGQLRPFDRAANGTLLAEGSVVLVLKTLAQAHADGDTVHAVVLGSGTSSDGKAAAIHSPAARGQLLAVQRAWQAAGVTDQDIDWMIAHGTATTVGDTVELAMLRKALHGRKQPCPVTSNKAIFGHTSANSGLVSVVNAMLGLRHDVIARQPYFDRLPDSEQIDQDPVRIPTEDIPWPSQATRPRIVGVSAAGFGGANAHVVLSDNHEALATRFNKPMPKLKTEPMVLVGYSAVFPGADTSAVQTWLRGDGPAPELSFGQQYPVPSHKVLLIPPVTARQMDRTQLLTMQSVAELRPQLGAAWEQLRTTTATISAVFSLTRRFIECGMHFFRADTKAAVDTFADSAFTTEVAEVIDKAITEFALEPNSDAFTGLAASVSAGRVANYFDLQGPAFTVHAGFDGSQVALRAAQRSLRHGDCDLALVCVADGNTLPEVRSIFGAELPPSSQLAEGAVALALTRESVASEYGLPILASIDTDIFQDAESSDIPPRMAGDRCYLSASGALEVLRSVVTGTATCIQVRHSGSPAVTVTPGVLVDKGELGKDELGKDELGVAMTLRLVDNPTTPIEQPLAVFPPDTLVVCDDSLLTELVPDDLTVWTTKFSESNKATTITPEDVASALAKLTTLPKHLRILTRCASGKHDHDPERTLALQDLAFAVIQGMVIDAKAETLETIGSLVVDALSAQVPHPMAGLIAGTLQSVATDLPHTTCVTVLTEDLTDRQALERLAVEIAGRPPEHTVAYRGPQRLTYRLVPADSLADSDTQILPLDRDSVILAIGGAQGITAGILEAVAERTKAEIYLVGRTPLSDDDNGSVVDLASFIRQVKLKEPERSVKDIRQEHGRLVKAARARDTINKLVEHSGVDRVHYLRADITDPSQVQAVVNHILARHLRIDLVLHAATESRSRMLGFKSLADFRSVRDVKVRGYINLRKALRDKPPRIWCNFSSIAVVFGNSGDADYVSANEFLSCVARDNFFAGKTQEFSIIWSAWSELGKTAEPLTRDLVQAAALKEFISPQTGIAQFFEALKQHRQHSVVTFIRKAELDSFQNRGIEWVLPRKQESSLVRSSDFDEQSLREGYNQWLTHHRVKDRPVLPGVFTFELAAQVAQELLPHLNVVGFRNLRCSRPLIVRQGKTLTVKTKADLIHCGLNEGAVRIQILAARNSEQARSLLPDLLCHEVEVLLAASFPLLNSPEIVLPQRPAQAPALYRPNPIVQLSGPFASTIEHRSDAAGNSAVFSPPTKWHNQFEHFRTPMLLFDAVAQTTLLDASHQTKQLSALTGIDTVNLAVPFNDTELLQKYGTTIRLYAPADGTADVYVLAGKRVLAKLSGISGSVLGFFDLVTGRAQYQVGPAAAAAEVTTMESS